jgi:RNA polymerase sigma-70 factor (ECF subfamily)
MAAGGAAPPSPGAEADLPADEELLARHVAGDPDAFAELVRRHRDRLWRVALRTSGDPEEAADALQDALLSAYRRAATFRGEARVTTWLHRVVVNACLDRVRRRAARPSVPLPEHPDGGLDERDPALRVEAPDPVEARETALEVAAALARLPAEQRAALVLVDMEGYPVAEAAGILGCAEGTVKSRCARGRARLLPLLGHLASGRNLSPAPGVPPVPGTGPPAEEVP